MWLEQTKDVLFRSIGSIIWPRGKLVIVLYHRVLPEQDPLLGEWEIDKAVFAVHMETLKRNFNVLGLREAASRLRKGTLPSRAVCVTFDDGYADNEEVALPILQQFQIPATFFIASGFLDGGRMWNDTVIEAVRRFKEPVLDLSHLQLGVYSVESLGQRRQAIQKIIDKLKYISLDERKKYTDALVDHVGEELPNSLMMSSEQVRHLHNEGMEIGGHTVHHPILTTITEKDVEREMTMGKQHLENIIGEQVNSFAYPNGRPEKDYTKSHSEIAKRAGFDICVSTAWGAAGNGADQFQLPRIAPWDRDAIRFSLRVLRTSTGKDYNAAG